MATSRTSLLSSATLAGLSDELWKIAEDASKKGKLKKLLKSTALIAGGAGAGVGASMLLEAFVRKNFPGWKHLSPTTRQRILAPVIAGGTLASHAALSSLAEERSK